MESNGLGVDADRYEEKKKISGEPRETRTHAVALTHTDHAGRHTKRDSRTHTRTHAHTKGGNFKE